MQLKKGKAKMIIDVTITEQDIEDYYAEVDGYYGDKGMEHLKENLITLEADINEAIAEYDFDMPMCLTEILIAEMESTLEFMPK